VHLCQRKRYGSVLLYIKPGMCVSCRVAMYAVPSFLAMSPTGAGTNDATDLEEHHQSPRRKSSTNWCASLDGKKCFKRALQLRPGCKGNSFQVVVVFQLEQSEEDLHLFCKFLLL
jgi:hypothetical protein